MKKVFLLMGVLALLGCNQEQKEKVEEGFVINGKVTSFNEGTLLYLDDPDTQARIDSVTITNGAFQFKGKIEGPKQLVISTKFNNEAPSDHKYRFL
ncbi:DUF4369 domain-containing protein [uncultured Aquimarina sp.]|uniref:DUF4369 domain-containing protein n=1 Tax=uncultured Aquimarina sp. TaxID=575652 RepID=UPI002624864A|nr:DUF4369 domain-containing protein [uncultured Aquimarina sp.]